MKKFLIIIAFASSIFSFSFELEKKELYPSSDGFNFMTFVDWDRDGLIDKLETAYEDTITANRNDILLFRKNVGTAKNPVYSDGEKILDEKGEPISFPHG